MPRHIFALSGPNLNLLGKRQPEIYGHDTLTDVEHRCRQALSKGFDLTFRQTNREGDLIDWIQEASTCACGILINPAGYSHTSVALFDALSIFEGPVIEVHISQIHRRESYRHHSYVSQRADGVILGLGAEGYAAAIRHICQLCQRDN